LVRRDGHVARARQPLAVREVSMSPLRLLCLVGLSAVLGCGVEPDVTTGDEAELSVLGSSAWVFVGDLPKGLDVAFDSVEDGALDSGDRVTRLPVQGEFEQTIKAEWWGVDGPHVTQTVELVFFAAGVAFEFAHAFLPTEHYEWPSWMDPEEHVEPEGPVIAFDVVKSSDGGYDVQRAADPPRGSAEDHARGYALPSPKGRMEILLDIRLAPEVEAEIEAALERGESTGVREPWGE
jgi:hypothetical protein